MPHPTLRNLIAVPCALIGLAGCFTSSNGSLPADEAAELRAQIADLEEEVEDLRGRVRVLDATIAHLYGVSE